MERFPIKCLGDAADAYRLGYVEILNRGKAENGWA